MKQTQAQQVKNILQELKDIKIAASKVESDLKLPAGVLWKVKTSFIAKGCPGPLELNEERMEKLIAYRDKKLNKVNNLKFTTKTSGAKKVSPPSSMSVKINSEVPAKIKIETKGQTLADILGSGRKGAGTTYKRVK